MMMRNAAVTPSTSSSHDNMSLCHGGACWFKRSCLMIAFLCLQWSVILPTCSSSSSPSSSSSGMILRVRRIDGSVDRIVVPAGQEQTMTLEQLLVSLHTGDDENDEMNKQQQNNLRLRIGDAIVEDLSRSISDLGLQHGSLLTIIMAKAAAATSATSSSKTSSPTTSTTATSFLSSSLSSSARWDPFPDLAKDYAGALRQCQLQQQKSRGRSSYTDLAEIQANLHVVEPQPEGPLQRVYMCRKSAERFQVHGYKKASSSSSGSGSNSSSVPNRIGLLLGNIQRERRRPLNQRKARTSLSTLPSDQEYCQVAKVHCIYEPPQQPSSSSSSSLSSTSYDPNQLIIDDWEQDPITRRVLELAKSLGLVPIGWIFTYTDDTRRQQPQQQSQPSSQDTPTTPVVLGPDVVTGAQLEMAKMKYCQDRLEGKQFVTLAMDAISGATEAFQLSDVAVQTVSEGLFVMESSSSSSSSATTAKEAPDTSGRFVVTKYPILVDGQETNQLDTLLCLINTALLSHEGDYCSTAFSGSTSSSSPVIISNTNNNNNNNKSLYKLTTKTKKAIRKAIEDNNNNNNNDALVFQLLSDFHILVALDQLLKPDEMSRLCQLVHKWVRGQKQGTRLDSLLKLRLKSVLS